MLLTGGRKGVLLALLLALMTDGRELLLLLRMLLKELLMLLLMELLLLLMVEMLRWRVEMLRLHPCSILGLPGRDGRLRGMVGPNVGVGLPLIPRFRRTSRNCWMVMGG
jgi:hypothetical protein